MSWRLAKSLVTLRSQVDAAYPNRSKASDGTIGDASHAATNSDHNPNSAGVVCAFDITHDPANGLDIGILAESLRADRHPDLKYLIANRRIASAKDGWVWRTYTGVDPHTSHVHVSVGVGPDGHSQQPYDDIDAWAIKSSQPVQQEIKGIKVTTFESFGGNISTDAQGNGYTDVHHTHGSDPVIALAGLNGNSPGREGYPTTGDPALLTSSYDGNLVIVTVVGAKPNSSFGFKVLLGW